MAINVLLPEIVFAKAVCDLRLTLEELREFDDNVEESGKHCRWIILELRRAHRWSWEFEYPPEAYWLYSLLRLNPPPPETYGQVI